MRQPNLNVNPSSSRNRFITICVSVPSLCHLSHPCPPGWGGEVRILSGALREPRRCLGSGRRTEWEEKSPPGRMADGWKVTGAWRSFLDARLLRLVRIPRLVTTPSRNDLLERTSARRARARVPSGVR